MPKIMKISSNFAKLCHTYYRPFYGDCVKQSYLVLSLYGVSSKNHDVCIM